MHQIHAEIPGTNFAHQRVHVRAIHIEQAAFGVKNVGDLVNLLLEDAQRVGIGEHQRGHIFIHLRFEAGINHSAGDSISDSRWHSRPWPRSQD